MRKGVSEAQHMFRLEQMRKAASVKAHKRSLNVPSNVGTVADPKQRYIVNFIPALENAKKLKKLLDGIARKDDTFSYSHRLNFFTLQDADKKRIYRRAMWLKETLEKDGIELSFTMSRFKLKEGCP